MAHRDDIFFAILAGLISAVAFAGFSFTYFGPIVGGTYPVSSSVLHVHGWSFFLWYLLFPLQPVLIARGRYALHARLGRWSMPLVAVMVLTGILVLTVRVADAARTGGPEVWRLYGPLVLSNLVLFVVFYTASIYMAMQYRLDAHKRLMMVASAIALGAGFFRLVLFLSGFHPLSLPAGVLACSIFILMGIAYDGITRRAVHPAYGIGLVVMLGVEVSLLPQINPDLVVWLNQLLASVGEHFTDFYTLPAAEF